MELNELQQLAACLEASGLHSLELNRKGERVKLTVRGGSEARIVTGAESVEATGPLDSPQQSPAAIVVTTESAGTFLATHPMRAHPLVEFGSIVKKHDVLGLLKVGLIYAPIIAPADGVVTQLLASDGALLGFGAPVLELGPMAGSA